MHDSNSTDQVRRPEETEMKDHLKDRKNFFASIFVLLCVLTVLSFWVANSHLMQRPLTGWAVMISISFAKAMLVVLFFMHLWWEKSWKYVITFPAMIFGVVLVLLLVPDVGYRFTTYSKTRRSAAPELQVNSSTAGGETSISSMPNNP